MIALKTALLSATIIALGTTSQAQQSCFVRQYTDDHMRKNPNQVVESIAIRFEGPATNKRTTGEWGDVTAYFNDTPTKFTQTLVCSSYDFSHWCGVECDGGRAEVRWKDPDTILLTTEGFAVSGGCDSAETEMRYIKDKTEGFTTFRLNRAAMDSCPPLDAN
jgi:hypothetical protein